MGMLGDVRHSIRVLLKMPRFTALAVSVLALGIGATSVVFSLVHSVLLRPLPYSAPDRLMVVMETLERQGVERPMPAADYQDFRDQGASFESMAAAEAWAPALTGVDKAEELHGLRASASLFRVLGVQAALGRGFIPADEQPGAVRVVVLADSLWRRRFGADRSVIGQVIRLNGHPATIVGVMPEGFYFPPFWATKAEIYTAPAYGPERAQDRVIGSLRAFGRLKPGVRIEAARAELQGIARRDALAHPRTNEGRTASVTPLHERTTGTVRTPLLVLLAAVAFTLLIACANVANMLLARATARRREIAIRESLGAERWRLIRQFLTESLVLSLAGGLLGLVLALAATPVLLAAIPESGMFRLPRQQEASVHGAAILFNFLLCAGTGILFGMAPAFASGRSDLTRDLKDTGRGSTAGRPGVRLRTILVGAEVALAVMLLAGSGLLIRTFQNLRTIDPGFDPKGAVAISLALGGSEHSRPDLRAQLYVDALERIRNVPGVRSASAVNHVPLAGDLFGAPVMAEGRPQGKLSEMPNAVYRVAMPGYFGALGMTLLAGRDFDSHDTEQASPVAVINSAMARRLWPGENALGKRFKTGDLQSPTQYMTVVGIIKDVKQWEWAKMADSEFYVPFWQDRLYLHDPANFATLTLVVRTVGDAAALAPALRQQIWAIDPNVAIPSVLLMDQVVSDSLWQPRASMALLTAFSALAALLSGIGIYGVMSYVVAGRTQEIGVRMALGASNRDVIRMVLRQAMRPVVVGGCIGMVTAAGLTRLMAALLYGVKPNDPLVFAAVTVLLAGVAAAGALLPARRAAAVDPITALRWE
jgi:putative ABC transport system permease protein